MTQLNRRAFFRISAVACAVTGGTSLAAPYVMAKANPIKVKFGNDLPDRHSVNARLREAIAAITAETDGALDINLFPNNQLGSDPDMMSLLRSGALELATMPGTVLSNIIPSTARSPASASPSPATTRC